MLFMRMVRKREKIVGEEEGTWLGMVLESPIISNLGDGSWFPGPKIKEDPFSLQIQLIFPALLLSP